MSTTGFGPEGPNAKRDLIGKHAYLLTDTFVRANSFRSGLDLFRIGERISSEAIERIPDGERDDLKNAAYWDVHLRGEKLPPRVRSGLHCFVQNAFYLSHDEAQKFLGIFLDSPTLGYFRATAQLGRKNFSCDKDIRTLKGYAVKTEELQTFLSTLGVSKDLIKNPHSRSYLNRHLRSPYESLHAEPRELLLFGEAVQAIANTILDLQERRVIPPKVFQAHAAVMEEVGKVRKGALFPIILTDIAMGRDLKADIKAKFQAVQDGSLSSYELGFNRTTGHRALQEMTGLGEKYLSLAPRVQTVAKDIHIPGVPRARILTELAELDTVMESEGVTGDIGSLMRLTPMENRGELLALLQTNPRAMLLVPLLRGEGLPSEEIFTALIIFASSTWAHDPEKTVQQTLIEGNVSFSRNSALVLMGVAPGLEKLSAQDSRAFEQTILERPDLLLVLLKCLDLSEAGKPYSSTLAYELFLSGKAAGLRSTLEKLNQCSEERCKEILEMEEPLAYFHKTSLINISKTRLASQAAEQPKKPVVLHTPTAETRSYRGQSWQELMLGQLEQSRHPLCDPKIVQKAFEILPGDMQNRIRYVYANAPASLESVVTDINRYGTSQVFNLLLRNQELFELYVADIGSQNGMRARVLDLVGQNPKNPAHALASLVSDEQKERIEETILVDQTDEQIIHRKGFPYTKIIVIGGMPGRGYWEMDTRGYPFEVQFVSGHAHGRINIKPKKTDYLLMLTDDCDHPTYWKAKKLAKSGGDFHHYRSGKDALERHFAQCIEARGRA